MGVLRDVEVANHDSPGSARDHSPCADVRIAQRPLGRATGCRMTMPAPFCHSSRSPPLLPARGALIGLDLGTKTIGVAASDPDRRLAAGVETIARKTFSADAARLLALAAERKAVGLRARASGQHGRQRRTARAIDPRLRPQSCAKVPSCRSRSGTSGSRPPRSSAS